MSTTEKSPPSEARTAISPSAWNCQFLIHLQRKPASRKLRRCGHLDRSLKLTARRITVAPPRTPHERRNPRFAQNSLERLDSLRARRRKLNSRPGVQRNQIHLAAHPSQQLRNFSRMLWLVVHTAKQHILKRNPLPGTQRVSPGHSH